MHRQVVSSVMKFSYLNGPLCCLATLKYIIYVSLIMMLQYEFCKNLQSVNFALNIKS